MLRTPYSVLNHCATCAHTLSSVAFAATCTFSEQIKCAVGALEKLLIGSENMALNSNIAWANIQAVRAPALYLFRPGGILYGGNMRVAEERDNHVQSSPCSA